MCVFVYTRSCRIITNNTRVLGAQAVQKCAFRTSLALAIFRVPFHYFNAPPGRCTQPSTRLCFHSIPYRVFILLFTAEYAPKADAYSRYSEQFSYLLIANAAEALKCNAVVADIKMSGLTWIKVQLFALHL